MKLEILSLRHENGKIKEKLEKFRKDSVSRTKKLV